MKPQTIKSSIMYLSLLLSTITILLNYWSIPILSKFFTKYMNLYSAAVIILLLSIIIGVSNKMDLRLESNNNIVVSKTVLAILAIELFISLNFHILSSIQDRIWAYSICLTPSLGFVLSRPFVRLNNIEVWIDKS